MPLVTRCANCKIILAPDDVICPGCRRQLVDDENQFSLPALINCPTCNTRISSYATACPQCGYPLNSPRNRTLLYASLLEQEIEPYRRNGFQIVQQTDMSITMVQPKEFSIGLFILLLIILWPAAVIYSVSNRTSRDRVVCFRVTSDGNVEISGYTLEAAARARRIAFLIVCLSIAALVALFTLILRSLT